MKITQTKAQLKAPPETESHKWGGPVDIDQSSDYGEIKPQHIRKLICQLIRV